MKVINYQGSAIPHYIIWKELFKLYREQGGDIDDMWDMLVDLKSIEKKFQEPLGKGDGSASVRSFYWEVDGSLTNFHEKQELTSPQIYRVYRVVIDYQNYQATITDL